MIMNYVTKLFYSKAYNSVYDHAQHSDYLISLL